MVNGTGQYRLERRFPSSVQVYVGGLSPSELQQLEALLDADDLQRLSQAQIPHVLVSDSLDQVLVDILRRDNMQNLNFGTPESRKKFRHSIEPLLKWLKDMEKHKHVQLREESASHCMPPKPEAADSSINKPERRPSLPFVMSMHINQARNGALEDNCVIVYEDGRYRREKTIQRLYSPVRVQAFEGTVRPEQVSDLKRLLDDPSIRTLQHQNLGREWFRQADLTALSIPRKGFVQNLVFSSLFGVEADPKSAGGMSGNQGRVDHDEHVMNPVRRWIKDNIEHDKVRPLRDAKATDCVPSN